jgi:NhaP-type Na+/H+ or K+/H+ antiporter
LLLVLPPLIYSSAVAMSWREFRFNLRPISLLALGCVAFTTVATAAAAHWALGLPWPVGFVLGAIVSPPDAVAPLSVARRMQLPRRILVVLEGEGLANDATALVLYRFAVAAVSAGMFSLGDAAITLSLITPFLAYWPPEYLGGSGVLATVTAGLYISWNGLQLISAATRLQGIFFWDFLIYLVEGLVFVTTGLQAHTLIARIGQYPLLDLAISAVVISAVVIVARFVWVFPAVYVPRWLSSRIRRRDPAPPWQQAFVLAFTGVRGIVSLAAALAIPFATETGMPFPGRDLILFLTFSVILVTLVGQGLMLPTVIRALGLAHAGRREHEADKAEECEARRQAAIAALNRLDELTAAGKFSEEILRPIRTRQRHRLEHIEHGNDLDERNRNFRDLHDEIEFLLIGTERRHINEQYRRGILTDVSRRRIERELDLREAELLNQRAEE